jgi:phospholipid-transporting ATPase
MLCIYSREDSIWVDTMNLDGETALKPKSVASLDLWEYIKVDLESVHLNEPNDINNPDDKFKHINKYGERLSSISGKIVCGTPNENLESWDGSLSFISDKAQEEKKCFTNIDSLLLRGCYLRNAHYCYGISVYLGKHSKIMMNAKKPPRKVSNLMIMMNYMLYTVFALQFAIIFVYATASVIWVTSKGKDYDYIDMDGDSATFGDWIIQLLTYWVAYSHMIPISLYVMIEVLKLTQASLIKWDQEIGAGSSNSEKAAE